MSHVMSDYGSVECRELEESRSSAKETKIRLLAEEFI